MTGQRPRGWLPPRVRITVVLAAVVLGPIITVLVGGFRAEALWSIPGCVVAALVMDQVYAWLDRLDRKGSS